MRKMDLRERLLGLLAVSEGNTPTRWEVGRDAFMEIRHKIVDRDMARDEDGLLKLFGIPIEVNLWYRKNLIFLWSGKHSVGYFEVDIPLERD